MKFTLPKIYPITDTRPLRTETFTTLLGAELHAGTTTNGELWHILAVGLPPDFAPNLTDEDGPGIAARAMAAGAFVSVAGSGVGGGVADGGAGAAQPTVAAISSTMRALWVPMLGRMSIPLIHRR